MGKKYEITGWNEVDGLIREIGVIDLNIGEKEIEMNAAITEAKTAAAAYITPLKAKREAYVKLINAFTLSKKDELCGRSKFLTYGSVKLRKSSAVTYPLKKTAEIIAKLKEKGLSYCYSVKESILREGLERLDDKTLAELPAERKTTERVLIEPDYEKVRV